MKLAAAGRLSTVVELSGIAAIVVGVWQVYTPAAWVIGGVLAVAWGVGANTRGGQG